MINNILNALYIQKYTEKILLIKDRILAQPQLFIVFSKNLETSYKSESREFDFK